MKKFLILIAACLILMPAFVGAIELTPKGEGAGANAAQIEEAQVYVPGEILVKHKDAASTAAEEDVPFLQGWVTKTKLPTLNTMVYKLPEGMDVETAIAELKNDPRVEYAEPNYYARPTAFPNDPAFSAQWGLYNTGQSVRGVAGRPGADINAPPAWDRSIGNGNIIVAIIDTGVDILHPDIRPNLWVNQSELAGYGSLAAWQPNGVDDDGNGYVDDVVGWDFFFNVNNPNDEVDGHGTHVAGIAAARGNNGGGVTGVAWQARIMALAAQNYASRSLPIDALARALIYAESMGAHVINMSLGLYQNSQTLRNAVNSVRRAVIVCAAGNDGSNNDVRPHYPSSYPNPNIVSVAATNSFDQRASFSNFGRNSVDVAAPGTNIYSTFSRFVDAGGYRFLSGTSMASPMVAGLAVLIRAANRDLSSTQVAAIIDDSVDRLAALASLMAAGGRINAAEALRLAGATGGDDGGGGDSGCFIQTLGNTPLK